MLNRRPKRIKYLKSHKGRVSHIIPRAPNLWGAQSENTQKILKYSLISCEPTRLTAAHIYAGELAIKRSLKIALEKGMHLMKAELIIPVFPHLPVTKKPAEVRMGKGKGSVDYFMTRIKTGTIIYEIRFLNLSTFIKNETELNSVLNGAHVNNMGIINRCYNIAKTALTIAQSKLPINTKISSK